nr:hypothetical protein [Anaerobacillus isosaccharinicus]
MREKHQLLLVMKHTISGADVARSYASYLTLKKIPMSPLTLIVVGQPSLRNQLK